MSFFNTKLQFMSILMYFENDPIFLFKKSLHGVTAADRKRGSVGDISH